MAKANKNAAATPAAATRVSAEQIAAAVAAYPATSGGRNIFRGRVGSRATVWDYGLLATPACYWTKADIANLYIGLQKRGLKPTDANGVPTGLYAAPDAAPGDHKATAYNPQHTAEHISTADLKKCWVDNAGVRQPHVLCVEGGWQINPAWIAHIRANGGNPFAGYPALPLQAAAAGKSKAAAAAAGKSKAAAAAAGKSKAAAAAAGKSKAAAAAAGKSKAAAAAAGKSKAAAAAAAFAAAAAAAINPPATP